MEKRLDVLYYLKEKKNSVTSTVFKIQIYLKPQNIFSSLSGIMNVVLAQVYTSNSRSVGILFSRNLDFKVHDNVSDPEGNFLLHIYQWKIIDSL